MPIVWRKKENITGLKRTQLEKPNFSPGSKCQRIVVKDTEEVRENSRWGKRKQGILTCWLPYAEVYSELHVPIVSNACITKNISHDVWMYAAVEGIRG